MAETKTEEDRLREVLKGAPHMSKSHKRLAMAMWILEHRNEILATLSTPREPEPLIGGEVPHPLVHEIRMMIYERSAGRLWPDDKDIADIIRLVRRSPYTDEDGRDSEEER